MEPHSSSSLSPRSIVFIGLVALAIAMGIGRFAFTPMMPLMVRDGSLDAVDMTRIDVVKQSYPDVMVLAQPTSEYDAPMVYFDVRVTEFSKDYTESLGIIWDDQINGPSWSLASDQRNNKYFRGQFPTENDTVSLCFSISSEMFAPIRDTRLFTSSNGCR